MRRLIVEPIAPAEASLRWATGEERAAAARFAPARAAAYLGWRALVRRELGARTAIAYRETGAPILPELPYSISVSHCRDRIAVMIADTRCGVDIERLDRRFAAILHRYLSPAEQQLSDDPRYTAVAWCAKETLYKYAGVQGADLLRDLCIDAVRFPERGPAPADDAVHAEAADGVLLPPGELWSFGTIRAHCERVAQQETAAEACRELTLRFGCTEHHALVWLPE